MSRSNNNKPFYVDVGTSIVAIRCASNRDVIMEYDYGKCPQVIEFTKDTCDRMNKEAENGKPCRNCDIGTAEEQAERFRLNCGNGTPKCLSGCKVFKFARKKGLLTKNGETKVACELIWAQMPYEEGGAG